MNLIPTPDARELPDDEAWRELFDTFELFGDQATEPMPLELLPLPESDWLAHVRKIFGSME